MCLVNLDGFDASLHVLLNECTWHHVSVSRRYANPGDIAVGYFTDAGKRLAALFLCVLHLRDCRRAAVGRASPEPLLLWQQRQKVSAKLMLFNASYLNANCSGLKKFCLGVENNETTCVQCILLWNLFMLFHQMNKLLFGGFEGHCANFNGYFWV